VLLAGLVLAAVAGAVHVFIFYLESVAWTTPRARAVFGTTEQQAVVTKELAYNQGFYNLFLAIMVFLGIALVAAGQRAVGCTLVLAGAGSMAAAATVLFLSAPDKRGAAIRQGAIPLLGVIALTAGLA